MSSAIRLVIALWCTLAAWPPVAARDHALIVGVSSYSDPRLPDLAGAANDARLLADLSRRRGIVGPDLVVLAQGSAPTTASGISAAFEDLLVRAQPGDRALILLSGHGIAIRDAQARYEDDELTEAFLASDARFDPATGTWSGIIRDNSIAGWLGLLERKGVDVLLVADFCESGGALRSASKEAARSSRFAQLLDQHEFAGKFAAVLASPQGQAARQGLGPPWKPLDEQEPHGLVSLYTALALEEIGLGSLGQMADWVAAQVARHSGSPPPIFIGDRSRPHPFAAASGQADALRWQVNLPATSDDTQHVSGMAVQAGMLSGLYSGAAVDIMDVAPGGEQVIARGRITGASILSARVGPDEMDPDPRWKDLRRADGSRPIDGGTFFVALRDDQTDDHVVRDKRRPAMLAAAKWASQRPGEALTVEFAVQPGRPAPDGACARPDTVGLKALPRTVAPSAQSAVQANRCDALLVRLLNRSDEDRYAQLAAFAPTSHVLLLPDPGANYHLLAPGEELLFGYQLTDVGYEEIFALSIDADYPLAERRLLQGIDPLRSGGVERAVEYAPGALQALALVFEVEG